MTRDHFNGIVLAVSAETGFTPEAILDSRDQRGRNCTTSVSRARWMVWKRLREEGLMLTEIAVMTGHHHTSVMYGIRRLRGWGRQKTGTEYGGGKLVPPT